MNYKDLIKALTSYRIGSYLAFKPKKDDAFQTVIDILLEENDIDWEFDLPEPIHEEDDDDWPDELKEGRLE